SRASRASGRSSGAGTRTRPSRRPPGPPARRRAGRADARPSLPSVVTPPAQEHAESEPDAERDADGLPRGVAHVARDVVHDVVPVRLLDLLAYVRRLLLHGVGDLSGALFHAGAERVLRGLDPVLDPLRGVGHRSLLVDHAVGPPFVVRGSWLVTIGAF